MYLYIYIPFSAYLDNKFYSFKDICDVCKWTISNSIP